MSNNLFVVDSCALISYFNEIFEADISVSAESLEVIDLAFHDPDVKLIFPATVFIEVFKKWCQTEEEANKIRIEVYWRIKQRENMEIQPFDKEILESFITIQDIEKKYNFDNHDKQILASAISMQCPLITSDERIIRYNKKNKVIPKILS